MERPSKGVCKMAKGILKFNEDKCKGCGLCVKYCPKQILGLNQEVVNKLGYFTYFLLATSSRSSRLTLW